MTDDYDARFRKELGKLLRAVPKRRRLAAIAAAIHAAAWEAHTEGRLNQCLDGMTAGGVNAVEDRFCRRALDELRHWRAA